MPVLTNRLRGHAASACVGLVLVAIAVFVTPVYAGSLVVAPSKIELQLEKNADATFTVEVSNTATMPMSVDMRAWDFARDEAGNVKPVGAADAARFHGCSAWVTLPSSNPVVVGPNETSKLAFRVHVPEDVANESRYCYLEFRSSAATPVEEPSGSNSIVAPVVYSMNALLLIQVGKPQASGVPAYKQGISLMPLLIKRLNFDPQVEIIAAIRNEGTIHSNLLQGSGFQIRQGGTLKATVPVQEYTLLPESTITVPAAWRTNALIGKYKVTFIGMLEAGDPIIAERTFWVVNRWFFGAVVGGVLLIATLMLIFFRRFSLGIHLTPRSRETG